MSVFFCMYVSTPHDPGWSEERALDPLELKLQMAVTLHIGAGNWIWMLCKNSCALTVFKYLHKLIIPAPVK